MFATIANAYNFTVGNISGKQGETKTISIGLNNETEDITAFAGEFQVPEGVEIIYNADEEEYAFALSGRKSTTHILGSAKQTSGNIMVTCYSSKNKVFTGTSGELFTGQLKLTGAPGTYTLKLVNAYVTSTAAKDFTCADVTFTVTIEGEETGGEEPGGEDDPSTGGTVDVTPRPTSGNYMFVDYVKAKAKQTVQIPVEVVTEEENIVGFQCNIKLPEGMEFVKNAKGNVVFTWNNDRIDGHTITSKIAADGSVKLLAASMNGSTFMETEGVMFYFSATVPEGMEGEQALQLYNVRVSDIDDNEIRCPDMTSVIDVKTYTLGDLNDDGEWSVVDVTMAIKAILDETYIEAGDMNEDGEMSVVDATTIIKYVLNEGPIEKASAPAAKRLKANAIADKPKFVVSPIYVEPGTNNMYLTVDMLNKEEYIGFQTEICLPEGFKFYTNSKGKPTVTLNTDRLETHTATSKLKDERTLRILVASMESDPILDNEGELLRVRVVADANVEAGNHTATLIDSRVSDDDDIETKLDVTNGYLRVFGEEAISLVVPEGGYATLCLPYAATLPTGLKAYKATGIKDDTVILEEQGKIAACTPLVIQGTAGTYNFSGDNSGADEFEYSVGSLKSSLVPAECNQGYVLQNLSEGLGFYKIKNVLTVPAFRSVLEGTVVNFAPAFVPVGFDEDANAISSVEAAMKNGSEIYTLDGKRVKTMEKGKIYIVGGVKMIVK